MKKIKMLTLAAGPEGNFQPGQILRVPDQIPLKKAQAFVAAGAAVEIKEELPPAKAKRETATTKPPETTDKT